MAGLPGLGATQLPSMKGFRAARRNRGRLHSYPAVVLGRPGLNLQVKGIGGSNWGKVGERKARKHTHSLGLGASAMARMTISKLKGLNDPTLINMHSVGQGS